MTTALFIPCYFDGLPRSSGSARIRAEWVTHYWDGAEVYDKSKPLAGYDLYVFQKAYLVEQTRNWIRAVAKWRDEGKCHLAFDLCDPDFLDLEHECRLLGLLPLFDFAVATTQPIADYLVKWLPTVVIPDRIDITEVWKTIGHHHISHTDRPTVVWAGYGYNERVLDGMREAVEELYLDLTIIALDRPIPFEEFWRQVIDFDILLNPRPNRPPFSYKSDNKTIIAQVMGMPVARTPEELRGLLTVAQRRMVSFKMRERVCRDFNVVDSVTEWKRYYGNWAHFDKLTRDLISEGEA